MSDPISDFKRVRISSNFFLIVSVLSVILGCGGAPAVAQCPGEFVELSPEISPPNNYSAIAYDSAREVTVYFGYDVVLASDGAEITYEIFPQTWEWDGINWLKRFPVHSPGLGHDPAMVYDSARGVCVMFGGKETWEWDGINWAQRVPVNSPVARSAHAMAFDSHRAVTVLFGGSQHPANNETWEYDGYNWLHRPSTTVPPARYNHAMAYDSARRVAVMTGGQSHQQEPYGHSGNQSLRDTWEWDGTDWLQRPSGWPGRTMHAMAYDSVRHVVILCGGYFGNHMGYGTWEWDGDVWIQRFPEADPSSRCGHAMSFDSARAVIVLFGGQRHPLSPVQSNMWEWSGPQPVILQQPTSQSLIQGDPASFSVEAKGSGTLTCVWRRDGTALIDGNNIAGATTENLIISPATLEDMGAYDCVITSECGSVVGEAASLSIDEVSPQPFAFWPFCGMGTTMLTPAAMLMLVSMRRRRWRRCAERQ